MYRCPTKYAHVPWGEEFDAMDYDKTSLKHQVENEPIGQFGSLGQSSNPIGHKQKFGPEVVYTKI